MGLGEIIDAVRDNYIAQFEATVAEQSRLWGEMATEAALRDESGDLACEGSLQLPIRIDIIEISDGQPVESVSVDSQALLKFEPVTFTWEKRLQVTLGPFWWDSLRARLSVSDWKPLQAWFMKWFSPDDDGRGELIGVVHFLTDPEPDPAGHSVIVDLGTSPVAAFEELLDAFIACGASTVLIGEDDSATPEQSA